MPTSLHPDTADLARPHRQDPPEAAGPAPPRTARNHMAPSLLAFIWRESALAQVGLALLAVAVFLAGLAPIELQRRAVGLAAGLAVRGADPHPLVRLALLYMLAAAGLGGLKLALNLGRGFVGERAVRRLRAAIMADLHAASGPERGIAIAVVLDEAEPVGSFVGVCLSEPLLQAGVLVSTLAYLAFLHPPMALVTLAVFSPQLVFVPLMQRAINRRVAARVGLLRRISGGLVERPAALPGPTPAELDRLGGVFRLNMGIFGFKFSMNVLMNLSYHLGVAGILAVGGYAVAAGEAEIGTVVAFVSGLSHMNDPWGDLVGWFRDVSVTRTKYDLIVRATSGPAAERA